MSNPLRWFRHNSKVLVVVLGIGAMAIFGLGPVFDVLSKPSHYEDVEDPVVAQWNGGKLTRRDVTNLGHRYYQVQEFLTGLRQAAAKKVEAKGGQYRPLVQAIRPIRGGGRSQQEMVDDQLMGRLLLAEKAKKEGFVVTDSMIDEYLSLLAGDAEFSRNDLIAINKDANQNTCSLEQVRRHLKTELLTQQMDSLAMTGMPLVPNPTEAMQLHGKMTARTECEVVGVSVAEFLDQVTETPSNADLRAYYNEGKYDYPDPAGNKPGFKLGKKVVAQYMVADFDTFLANEMNKLTDAEVQEEYDRLVAAKDDLVMEIVPEDEAPTDEASGEGADNTDQSIQIRRTKFSFVSLRAQEAETPTTETPAAVEATELPETAAAEPVAEPTEKEKATETQATDPVQDAGDGSATPEDTSGDAETEAEAAADPTEPADTVMPGSDEDEDAIGPLLTDETKLKKRAKPLRDVADAIKRRLKSRDAAEAMDKAIVGANRLVTDYRMDFLKWDTSANPKPEDKPPAFDYKAVAKKFNLLANETALVDDIEMDKDVLGKIMTLINVRGPNGQSQPRPVTVGNLIFNDFNRVSKYESNTVQDFQNRSAYLYWLSEKQPPRIPAFEECREEVVKFWKHGQAVKLATVEAQNIVDRANASDGKNLIELYPDRTIKTGEFTWFSNFRRTSISIPVGVSNPGDQFMETAFGLDKLAAGVSPNANQDTIYAIQNVADGQEVDAIAADYLENQFFKFKAIPTQVRDASVWYGREMSLDWNEEFVNEMGLEVVGH